MQKTCVSSNHDPVNRKTSGRIAYFDDKTGWRCIFEGMKFNKSGKCTEMRLHTFYNEYIPETVTVGGREVEIKRNHPMNDSFLIRSSVSMPTQSFNRLTLNKLSNSDGSGSTIVSNLIHRKDTTCLSNNQIFMQENLAKSNNMTIFQYLKSKTMKNSIVEDEREFWQDNAFSFEGVFDLDDNSYSMKTLNSYLKSKGKRTI